MIPGRMVIRRGSAFDISRRAATNRTAKPQPMIATPIQNSAGGTEPDACCPQSMTPIPSKAMHVAARHTQTSSACRPIVPGVSSGHWMISVRLPWSVTTTAMTHLHNHVPAFVCDAGCSRPAASLLLALPIDLTADQQFFGRCGIAAVDHREEVPLLPVRTVDDHGEVLEPVGQALRRFVAGHHGNEGTGEIACNETAARIGNGAICAEHIFAVATRAATGYLQIVEGALQPLISGHRHQALCFRQIDLLALVE